MPLLPPQKDPMGTAIRDYHAKGTAKPLRVLSSMFDNDVLPVPTLFRGVDEMNRMEQTALHHAEGRVLDVGAGAGCHSLPLQERGLHVTAIDISSLSVETMQQRGVIDARQEDFFTFAPDVAFDTILMLMNGTGIVGTLDNLPLLFDRLLDASVSSLLWSFMCCYPSGNADRIQKKKTRKSASAPASAQRRPIRPFFIIYHFRAIFQPSFPASP